ncbi:MAG: sigma-54-dependent Fis family transcriptional regulator [Phyllobacteriaceae bacterium]|nr:sigma-54-dependent Fis family transcriptional regulator [Phyllobacteriaceae bacterium]
MRRPSILVVEDDAILADSLLTRLTLEGMDPVRAADCGEALAALDRRSFDAVVSDIRLPDGSGEEIFRSRRARRAVIPTIFTTAFADVEQAVRLVKLGAVDYLTKPYDLGVLVDLLARVTRAVGEARPPVGDVPARSPAMARLAASLDRLAESDRNLLLIGAAGTGKKTLARRLHDRSTRAGAPFVVVEGAGLTAAAGDRILFGAVAADGGREPGLAVEVGEGTLLVAEIADIAAEMQARLPRFVEEHVYRPVGGTLEEVFAGRLMATATAASEPPPGLRADLVDRFGVLAIHVPALAERGEDLLPLAEAMLAEAAAGSGAKAFSRDAVAALEAHDWPGNLRELRNRIVRAHLLAEGETLAAADLFPERPPVGERAGLELDAARRDAERQVIEAALAENGGRIVETAKALGISRVTLWSKMKRFGIAKE